MNQPSSMQEDNVFATEAVRRGYVSVAQIDEAKAVQKKLAEIGIQEPLSSVMVKRNYLTKEQAASLAAGGKETGKVVIPGYKVTAKIGSGGMGTVYKATQLSIGRQVAIKILSSRLSQDAQYAERFAREAKALAQLNHVNIVSAIDAGRVGNVMYYVMEYVEGESLGDVLKRRRKIPEAEALHVAIQTVRALDHANTHGIIHRDIKPDNILITKDGIAKLTDLGLAKTKGEDANLTQTGIAIGTPNYISPEQARGERDLDTRSDIYSMGATLYHMVVGEAPFKGSSALEVVTKHLTEQLPSPKTLNPALSDGVCIVVEKMMTKRREDRYQSPQDLLADMELVADGKMPKAVRPAVGRSAVMQRVAVPGGKADHGRSAPRPATTFTRTSRSTATQLRIPASGNPYVVPLSIAAGVLILIVVIALASKGGSNTPIPEPETKKNSPPPVVDSRVVVKPGAPDIAPPQPKKPNEERTDKKPVADARPEPPRPAPMESSAGPKREAELLIKSLAYEVDNLKEAGRYREAMAKLDEIESKKRTMGVEAYDTGSVRNGLNEEAEETVRKAEEVVGQVLETGVKQTLLDTEKILAIARERQLTDKAPRYDAMIASVKKAVADFDNPIKARHRFRAFYDQSMKLAIDFPCLNFDTASWLIEKVMDAKGNFERFKDDFVDPGVRDEMKALKRDFDEIVGLMKKLRETREVEINGDKKHVHWSERIGEFIPFDMTPIVLDEDEVGQEILPVLLNAVARRAFREKLPEDKRLLAAVVLFHAYEGADFALCEKMAKAFKVNDEQKLLDRVRRIREDSLFCDFAREARTDLFGFLDLGQGDAKPPVAAKNDPKDPPQKDIKVDKQPKVDYNARPIISKGVLQGDVKKVLEEWEKDGEIEGGKTKEGLFFVGVRKGEERKILPLGEEMDDVEISLHFKNTSDEYTRFYLRADNTDKEPKNAIRVDVKIHGEHKGKVEGKVKAFVIVNGKEREIDSEGLEVPAMSNGEGFVIVIIRLDGDQLSVYVNKPSSKAAHDFKTKIKDKDAPSMGRPAIVLPEFRPGDEDPRALYVYQMRLQRIKKK